MGPVGDVSNSLRASRWRPVFVYSIVDDALPKCSIEARSASGAKKRTVE